MTGPLLCPKCGMKVRKMRDPHLSPFEGKYYCPKCDAYYLWKDYADYHASCEYEREEQAKSAFNPSLKGRPLK